MSRSLQFFHFGLMPYPYIPPGTEIESTWVTLPNKYYDPKIGHRLYNEYLDQAVLAEKLGYDGTRFWIAWLDGKGELRLTSFEVATGKLVQYELPGWQPNGPEAFELVRRGGQTALVLLSPDGLEFLTICT